MSDNCVLYLNQLKERLPQFSNDFIEMRDLYEKKLWHQLTLKLQEFITVQAPKKDVNLLELYENFITKFESRINQIALVTMLVALIIQISNVDTRITVLQRSLERIIQSDAPRALLHIELGRLFLLKAQQSETKLQLDLANKILESQSGLDPTVHANYYRLAADFAKVVGKYGEFYRHSLKFLSCINPMEDLPLRERIDRTCDMGIAALMADNIYQFGELLVHPIFSSLSASPDTMHQQLSQILIAFNLGDVKRFQDFEQSYLRQHPLLSQHIVFLRQKMCLMALIELAFIQPSNTPRLTFSDIATSTHLPLEEVEHLVMKALSLKILEAEINQVEEAIRFTWIQPRVLDHSQLALLRDRLSHWADQTSLYATKMIEKTPDLFVRS